MQDLDAHPSMNALVFSRSMFPVTHQRRFFSSACMRVAFFGSYVCQSLPRPPCLPSDPLRQVPSASPRYPDLTLPYDYILQG